MLQNDSLQIQPCATPVVAAGDSGSGSASRLGGLVWRKRTAGALILEVIISIGLIAVAVTSSIIGLMSSNRQAMAYRAMTAARLIVERNIETALAVNWDAVTTPPILATTSASGSVWDDDGGGDNKVNILVQDTAGTVIPLKGTLTRTVLVESTSSGAPVRRVTFKIAYAFGNKNYSTSMTTFRTTDDF